MSSGASARSVESRLRAEGSKARPDSCQASGFARPVEWHALLWVTEESNRAPKRRKPMQRSVIAQRFQCL